MSSELTPWWWATAVGAVASLVGGAGKVWSDQRREIRELRVELAAANARIAELLQEGERRGDEHQSAHLRDLRRIAGLASTPPSDPWPPPVVKRRG